MKIQMKSLGKVVFGVVMSTALILPTTTAFAATDTNSVKATTATTATTASEMTSEQKADKLIEYAKSLEGKVKYVYGKNDPSKMEFDCSSFTKYVYKQALGIDLKWGANAQYKQGTPVAKEDLKKGDLVFLSVKTPGKIGHVGIYMGDGKFIHNTTGKVYGVTTGDLNKGYWSTRFVSAARYF